MAEMLSKHGKLTSLGSILLFRKNLKRRHRVILTRKGDDSSKISKSSCKLNTFLVSKAVINENSSDSSDCE
jgi:hypothetical protein